MWMAIVLYLACSIFGLLLMKQGLNHTTFAVTQTAPFLSIGSQLDLRVVMGAAFYLTSFLTWLFLLKKYNLSYIFPITTGLSYVGVLAVSYFALAERFNAPKLVGALLILVGVVLVYRNNI
ncbi:MAG TPA: hypothetical protein GX513_12515 [Firmicutes bacterium]|nr:hypothetical protein [Bacillota bacterium]